VDIKHAHIGRRVRELRVWRDMDQTVVAGLAGITQPYLSMIERGHKAVTTRALLEALAHALRVSPLDLTDQPYTPPTNDSDNYTAMAVLGDLLGGWWVGEVPDAPDRLLDEVLDELAAFQTARNSAGPAGAGGYPEQVATLAPLIRDLLAAAVDPQLQRRALPPLLTAYHVAGSIAARLRIPGMPSLAADRMRQVAEALDDPVWDAVALWGRAHFLSGTNRQRQYEMAVAVADDAPMDRPETRGMANLTAGLAAAAQGQADVAETHLAEAAAIADLVEPDVSPWPSGIMQFGRTNVGIFRVAVGVEMGAGPQVTEFAQAVHPESISRGRQASFWIDLGRGMLADRQTRLRGAHALRRAHELAPQQLRASVFAREAVTTALPVEQRRDVARELRWLAWEMGVAPTG
jgi:transcriptional regulator with XRE-family HTH domain